MDNVCWQNRHREAKPKHCSKGDDSEDGAGVEASHGFPLLERNRQRALPLSADALELTVPGDATRLRIRESSIILDAYKCYL